MKLIQFFLCLGIIRDEDLERMDKIGKEEGWTNNDEIDYNQKLVFSDDESDTPMPQSKGKDKTNDNKRGNDNKDRSLMRKDEDNRSSKL